MGVCELFEIVNCLADQAEFKHQNTVIKSALVVIGLHDEAAFNQVNGMCEVAAQAFFRRLSKIEVTIHSFGLAATTDRENSNLDSDGVKHYF